VLVPILTFVLGAATGGLLVKRERTPMQILAAVTGMVLLGYAVLLVSDGLFLYLDYLDSRKWLAGNLLNINPLLLQALATAMALLHFTVAPSILWAFASLQHRRFAILTGTLVCGSLLAMYVFSPQRYFDSVGNHLYNFSRDSQNCIHLYNVEVKFDPNTGAELRGAGGDIVEEYQRQKMTHSCAAPGEEPRPRPTSFPRPVVLRFAHPPEDRLKTPPFSLPAHNYSTLPAQGTNIWSESVSLAPGVTLLKLAIQGWNESPGWVQPAVEDATYITDQAGNRYRLLADYGRYTDSCPSGAEILRCHTTLPGEVYRFDLAFENLDDGARQLRLYYSGLGGPLEAAAFTSPIGDWRRNPNGSAVPAEVVQSQPAVPSPSTPPQPQQPAASSRHENSASQVTPAAAPAPQLCSAPISILSTTLPSMSLPGEAVVRLDWVGARLYLQQGALPPQYPPSACYQHVHGSAVLDLVAGPDGSVRSVQAVRGQEPFISAATRAVRTWRFSPVHERGRIALLATRIQFEFGASD
jgi:TonB family protein